MRGEEWLDRLAPVDQRALLLGVVDVAARTADLTAMAASAAELVTGFTGATACLVYVLDENRGSVLLAGTDPSPGRGGASVAVPLGEGLVGRVASSGRPGADGAATAVPVASRRAGLVGVLEVPDGGWELDSPPAGRLRGIGRLLAEAFAAARLHQQQDAREESRLRTTEALVALEEAERRRLAADIHDGVSQRVVSLSFHLAAAAEALTDQPLFAAQQIAAARRLTELTLDEARAAVQGLRPAILDDLGLPAALASLGRTAVGLHVEVEADAGDVPDHLSTVLYRIAQEALQNVMKHASAERAVLELHASGTGDVVLRVHDDGEGFDPADSLGGYGLATMRERAELVGGRLELVTRRGGGTTLSVWIPRGQ